MDYLKRVFTNVHTLGLFDTVVNVGFEDNDSVRLPLEYLHGKLERLWQSPCTQHVHRLDIDAVDQYEATPLLHLLRSTTPKVLGVRYARPLLESSMHHPGITQVLAETEACKQIRCLELSSVQSSVRIVLEALVSPIRCVD